MPKYKKIGKYTEARTWAEIKYEKMAFVMFCEVKGCRNAPVDAHHVFIGQDNRARKGYKKHLNKKENMQLVCKKCHEGYAKTWKNKQEFMEVQKKRYDMLEWFTAIPQKKQDTHPDIKGLL